MLAAKSGRVIRVPVPIDVAVVSETRSGAFACATPLRAETLLALAVREALGQRAPSDKRERGIRTTLRGFAEGRFVIDIDGRIYERPDDVVVCCGVVTLRFFSSEARRRSLPAR